MSIVSKEQIETIVRELLVREETSLERLSLSDILPEENEDEIDLKSLFITLGAIQTEMKQVNRTEKLRLETFKEYFDDERSSKQQLLENINTLVTRAEFSEQKPILLSLVEIRDFVEVFHQALSLVFTGNNALFSLVNKLTAKPAFNYVRENVAKTLKKIDQLLERASVYPIFSDNVAFDPAIMMAVETLNLKNRSNLAVIETVEKGYLHHEKVLRLAKVKVNRNNSQQNNQEPEIKGDI